MNKEARVLFSVLMATILAVSFAACSSQDQGSDSATGDHREFLPGGKIFQDIEFPLPETEKERSYLGLSGDGNFKISQIKTKVLLIEVFSNLCPHCHTEAPQVNKLYEAIEERPDIKGKVKIIGIGAANGSVENNKFRKMHNVPFPLFPDKDFSTTMDVLKISATPTFIGITFKPEGTLQSFYFKSGPFGEAPEFLAQVLKLSGLEKEV